MEVITALAGIAAIFLALLAIILLILKVFKNNHPPKGEEEENEFPTFKNIYESSETN